MLKGLRRSERRAAESKRKGWLAKQGRSYRGCYRFFDMCFCLYAVFIECCKMVRLNLTLSL